MIFWVLFYVHGTEEASRYQQGHRATLGNALNCYESLVSCVCLGALNLLLPTLQRAPQDFLLQPPPTGWYYSSMLPSPTRLYSAALHLITRVLFVYDDWGTLIRGEVTGRSGARGESGCGGGWWWW